MEMPQSAEPMPGIKVERIGLAEFVKHKSQIEKLRFNLLGEEDDSVHDKIKPTTRREELKPIREELRDSVEHEAIYLAKDKNDKVIGFMYIELKPDGREARLKDYWSSIPEVSQEDMIRKFLDKASELPDEGYPHLDVETSVMAKHFKHLATNPKYHFLRIKDAPIVEEDSDSPKASLEKKGR